LFSPVTNILEPDRNGMRLLPSKQFWAFLFFLMLYAILPSQAENHQASAGNRLALVIGNSEYVYAPDLKNTANDARDIGNALQDLGFKVELGINLTKSGLLQKVRSITDRLQGSETILFYYAGHAIQVKGENYLAPVDMQITDEKTAVQQSTSLDSLVRMVGPKASRLMLFLDACRNNPLKKNRDLESLLDRKRDGLVRTNISRKNTLIVFATEPGNVAYDGAGRNSPFAQALLSNIKKPGLDISALMRSVRRQVFDETSQKQLPWTSSSLLTGFFFDANLTDATALPTAPERLGDATDAAGMLATANEFFEQKSFAQAAEFYRKAAEIGVIPAMTAYGNLLSLGLGIAKNPVEAQGWYIQAAEMGDSQAQFLVGRNYERGTGGLAKSYKMAVNWYRKAAKGGNSDAMNNLAVMLSLGEGVRRDFSMAVKWYSQAAQNGSGDAMFNLGGLYDEGNGVEKSSTLAARWVIRSILEGVEPARLEMLNNSRAWSKSFRLAVQKELKKIGLYAGGIDGVFGRRTKMSIKLLK